MARVDLNRVLFSTSTTGTGSITVGSAATGYRTPVGAGGADGQTGKCVITDGNDYEISHYTLSSSATVVSRDTVEESVIAGVRGTSKINLSGNANVEFVFSGADINAVATRQVFTSGSGTYTTPTDCRYIDVELVGGGGGGAGSGTSAGNGGGGGNTTFGTSLLTGNGGGAGTVSGRGTGGTATGGDVNITGGDGCAPSGLANQPGGGGGISFFGGASPAFLGTGGGAGSAAQANSGAGGAGAGDASAANSGGSGGAGGYCRKIISSPAATYSYAVGSGGSAGSAGTGGFAGGAGGSGLLIVTEYYK